MSRLVSHVRFVKSKLGDHFGQDLSPAVFWHSLCECEEDLLAFFWLLHQNSALKPSHLFQVIFGQSSR